MCVFLKDEWPNLKNLRVRAIEKDIIVGPYTDVMNIEPARLIPLTDADGLLVSPYSRASSESATAVYGQAVLLRDLASSHLRDNDGLEVGQLVALLSHDTRLAALNIEFI